MNPERVCHQFALEMEAFERSFVEFKGTKNDRRLGEVAHCHLMVEHYLTEFLTTAGDPFAKTRIEYWQKVERAMFPGCPVLYLEKALKALGSIRNGFCHNIHYQPDAGLLGCLRKCVKQVQNEILHTYGKQAVAELALPDEDRIIEEFTKLACAQLTACSALIRSMLMDKPSELVFPEPAKKLRTTNRRR